MKREEKLLVVVDMIRGFVGESEGKMVDPTIAHINGKVERLVELFLKRKYDVIAFQDEHHVDSTEFKKFPEHCVQGTEEVDFISCLERFKDQMICIGKNSTNGFMTPAFYQYFLKHEQELNEVVVVGCCTDLCVLNFVLSLICYCDQKNLDIKVTVVEEAVETYDAGYHPRDEYNQISKKLMKQMGTNLVKHY